MWRLAIERNGVREFSGKKVTVISANSFTGHFIIQRINGDVIRIALRQGGDGEQRFIGMSFSLGNEWLHPFRKNFAKQLDATRHMRQTQIGDVSGGGFGVVDPATYNF